MKDLLIKFTAIMQKYFLHMILKSAVLFIILIVGLHYTSKAQSIFGRNDTLIKMAVVFEGDTIEAKQLLQAMTMPTLTV